MLKRTPNIDWRPIMLIFGVYLVASLFFVLVFLFVRFTDAWMFRNAQFSASRNLDDWPILFSVLTITQCVMLFWTYCYFLGKVRKDETTLGDFFREQKRRQFRAIFISLFSVLLIAGFALLSEFLPGTGLMQIIFLCAFLVLLIVFLGSSLKTKKISWVSLISAIVIFFMVFVSIVVAGTSYVFKHTDLSFLHQEFLVLCVIGCAFWFSLLVGFSSISSNLRRFENFTFLGAVSMVFLALVMLSYPPVVKSPAELVFYFAPFISVEVYMIFSLIHELPIRSNKNPGYK